jgi:hypothetical protein
VLTQKIATDNLADAFMAFNTNYHDTGLFGVYAVTDRERSNDLSWVVMNEVRHTRLHAYNHYPTLLSSCHTHRWTARTCLTLNLFAGWLAGSTIGTVW